MFDLCSVFKGAGRLAVGGSRNLAGAGAAAFVDLASAWQAGGGVLGVGCSIGADALALQGLAVPRLASVFAACSPAGGGAWSGTALGAVRAAHARGASVHWLAGGPLALALPARLAARSRALALASPAGCLVALSSRAHSTPFGHLFHHHPAGDSTGIRPPVPRPCGRGSRSEATQAGHCYSAGVVDVKVRA